MPRILELFCGTKSISNVFKENGWEVLTVDSNPIHKADLCFNINNLNHLSKEVILNFNPDIIWASPPCTKFSIASCSHHWIKRDEKFYPRHFEAEAAINLVKQTKYLIEQCQPKYWFIENPRGLLRKMEIIENLPRKTVTYCQYGDSRMKPTDIWTNCDNWIPRPMCKNGQPCHEAAPRGSSTGTQGIKNVIDRSRIPRQLCEEIFQACKM